MRKLVFSESAWIRAVEHLDIAQAGVSKPLFQGFGIKAAVGAIDFREIVQVLLYFVFVQIEAR